MCNHYCLCIIEKEKIYTLELTDEGKKNMEDISKVNEKMITNNNRVTIYDWVRIIATLYVVIGHSAYLSIQTLYGGVDYQLPENVSYLYNSGILNGLRNLGPWIYSFHMPLFFCLSGAVLHLGTIKPMDLFCASKIRRLIIPFFATGLFFMIPVKYLSGFYLTENIQAAVFDFLSGGDASGHLWFLTALFWAMVIFVLVYKILSRFDCNSIYVLLFITSVMQFFLAAKLPFDILGLRQGLSYIFWFALGYWFDEMRRKMESYNKSLVFNIIVFILMSVLCVIEYKTIMVNDFFKVIIGCYHTYLLAVICSILFKKIEHWKAYKILIRNLFCIYLFHDPLEYVVLKVYMDNGFLQTTIGCITYTFLRIFGVIIVSIILGELIHMASKQINRFKPTEVKYEI